MGITQFIYPFFCRWPFGCFQFLVITDSAAVDHFGKHPHVFLLGTSVETDQ